jgi:hypothetical protein
MDGEVIVDQYLSDFRDYLQNKPVPGYDVAILLSGWKF